MDETVIPSLTEEKNIETLKRVLQVGRKHNKWKKCRFLMRGIKFLGCVVKNSSTKPSVKNNFKKLQRFLGPTSCFAQFVLSYAIIVSTFSNMVRKNNTFKIRDTELLAFQELKHCPVRTPVFSFCNPCISID